ncbi:MerR family transcriptional regulator [Paucilactobacillus suebicus]|nr:MerR family transcriptional regulator [Paucilactobacillus suebicus]
MDNLTEELQKVKEILLNRNAILVSMTDISKITGVSARQLRYWEQKGYIESVHDQSENRKYNITAMVKIGMIKNFIDEGFTVAKASEKAQEADQITTALHRVDSEKFNQASVNDTGLEFDLGSVAGLDEGKKLFLNVPTDKDSFF